MRSFFKKYGKLGCFSLFLAVSCFYFLLQRLPLQYHVVHTALDEKIPFLPIFVLPYVLWYAYVPVPMLIACFRDEARFRRQIVTLFSGILLCLLIFALYPTRIDFRPSAAGEGALLALCRLVYQNDQPVNVLPSLHCYEALAIHLATFCGKPSAAAPRWIRWLSAVLCALICLSTMFVKQHSVLDALAGCALAVLVHLLVGKLLAEKGKDCDHKTT